MPKPLTVWITTNWKILRDGNTGPPVLPPEKSVCRSRSKLELDMEQRIVSKSGKEYVKAVYCHPAYLTYRQSTPCEMPGWMKCRGPAPVDPGTSKGGRRWRGKTCLFINVRLD